MANWVKPDWSRKEVRRAGAVIVETHAALLEAEKAGHRIVDRDWHVSYSKAIGLLFSYRAAHAFPLNTAQITLRKKALSIDPTAVVAQRLKRFVSILGKLERFPNMQLDTMQDIGGCRAIVENVSMAQSLVKSYETSARLKRCLGDRKRDYIEEPKGDGYRSIHLIYRFDSTSPTTSPWNGFQIELQVRSKLQHAWAAAVETVDLFTRQSMKTGSGLPRWKRFMALMSSAIAIEEGVPTVPETPQTKSELVQEIRALHDELGVTAKFGLWRDAVAHIMRARVKKDRQFLIEIDLTQSQISIRTFKPSQSRQASEAYADAEKRLEGRTDAQVVLAGASSFDAVAAAFPAYFNDSKLFMEIMNRTLS